MSMALPPPASSALMPRGQAMPQVCVSCAQSRSRPSDGTYQKPGCLAIHQRDCRHVATMRGAVCRSVSRSEKRLFSFGEEQK
jgi:hypothetical protein